jgi:hypothetical protein
MAETNISLHAVNLPATPPDEYEKFHKIYSALWLLLSRPIPLYTPATSAARGDPGMISYDSNYLYICIDTNTWRRISHAAF